MLEREKEIEDKRRQDEERLKQQEVIKAKAVVTGPKQVGKIDLNPKKAAAPAVAKTEAPDTSSKSCEINTPEKAKETPSEKPVAKEAPVEKPVEKEAPKPKVTLETKEVEKPVVERRS